MVDKFVYSLGKLFLWVWRFKSLAFADRLMRDVESGCVMTRNLFGYKFSVDVSRSMTHRLLFLEGERVVGEQRLVTSLVEPGMRVVDVGANIGYYLLMFEQALCEDGEIICFEPEPANLKELKENIELNGFMNVVVHEAAIGLHEGIASLQTGINSRVVNMGEGDHEICVKNLDSMIKDPIDILKIDVDGYEAHVLLGAQEVLMKYKPRIFLEFHPHHIWKYGYSFKDIFDLLKTYYSNIDFYEIPLDMNIAGKINVRYLGFNPVCHIKDSTKLIADTNSGQRQRTFWIVCK